jgi:hypothetical protein
VNQTVKALYWGVEYLMALVLILMGPSWVLATVSKLVREPSVGEVLWLVFWLAMTIPLVQAGRFRWRVLNTRRANQVIA